MGGVALIESVKPSLESANFSVLPAPQEGLWATVVDTQLLRGLLEEDPPHNAVLAIDCSIGELSHSPRLNPLSANRSAN